MNPFRAIAAETIGLTTPYAIRNAGVVLDAIPAPLLPTGFGPGDTTLPLTYLDSTASTKMIGPVFETLNRALVHYANSHSVTHAPARISTEHYEEAHEIVRRFVNARPDQVAVFVGHGATGAINRLARTLFTPRPRLLRDTVVFSGMEHHANLLPWMKHAPRTIPVPVDPATGTLPLERLRETLADRKNRGRVRLVAVTAVSNVTGIVNDVAAIAKMAHEAGAEILVDAAQAAAHMPTDMEALGIDHLVFSGHKAYAPGSPGVLVTPRSSFKGAPDEMGGGIVLSVDLDRYLLTSEFPAREEAGTPSILGAVLLASALTVLMRLDMNRVWEHERELASQLIGGLSVFDEITVYGDTNLARTPRAGVASFAVDGLHHAVTSQALADYFNVAVRNDCFCAHPYVKALLRMPEDDLLAFERRAQEGDLSGKPGMVRASLGLYTRPHDIEFFHAALDWIVAHRERLRDEYAVDRRGVAVRRDGWKVDTSPHRLF